jgi:hypothetical protein
VSGKHVRRVPGLRVEDLELKFAAHLVDSELAVGDTIHPAEYETSEAVRVESPDGTARRR